jgi:Ca2+/Na+ antiporter
VKIKDLADARLAQCADFWNAVPRDSEKSKTKHIENARKVARNAVLNQLREENLQAEVEKLRKEGTRAHHNEIPSAKIIDILLRDLCFYFHFLYLCIFIFFYFRIFFLLSFSFNLFSFYFLFIFLVLYFCFFYDTGEEAAKENQRKIFALTRETEALRERSQLAESSSADAVLEGMCISTHSFTSDHLYWHSHCTVSMYVYQHTLSHECSPLLALTLYCEHVCVSAHTLSRMLTSIRTHTTLRPCMCISTHSLTSAHLYEHSHYTTTMYVYQHSLSHGCSPLLAHTLYYDHVSNNISRVGS